MLSQTCKECACYWFSSRSHRKRATLSQYWIISKIVYVYKYIPLGNFVIWWLHSNKYLLAHLVRTARSKHRPTRRTAIYRTSYTYTFVIFSSQAHNNMFFTPVTLCYARIMFWSIIIDVQIYIYKPYIGTRTSMWFLCGYQYKHNSTPDMLCSTHLHLISFHTHTLS